MNRWRRRIALLGLLPLVFACASTARITGGFAEYRAYREARVATTVEGRLGASQRYLQNYPNGDYVNELRRWFVPAEKHYLKLSWDNLSRLRAYLSVLPHGPHSEAVSERISELESVREYAARREQRMLERAQAFEQRLREAAVQRRHFLREFTRLTRVLGTTHAIGRPLAELDPELLDLQSSTDCDVDRCLTVLPLAYAVPQDKVLTERAVDLALEVSIAHGKLAQLSISAAELLSRVAEASRVNAVASDNPQARAEALGQALDIVSDALAESLPAKACAAESVSPIVLTRRCHGVRLEVIAATEAGGTDRVLVRADQSRAPVPATRRAGH